MWTVLWTEQIIAPSLLRANEHVHGSSYSSFFCKELLPEAQYKDWGEVGWTGCKHSDFALSTFKLCKQSSLLLW